MPAATEIQGSVVSVLLDFDILELTNLSPGTSVAASISPETTRCQSSLKQKQQQQKTRHHHHQQQKNDNVIYNLLGELVVN